MKIIRELFSENSDISVMRIMSVMSLIIGGYLALKGQNESVSIFVYAAFTGKVAQRFVESKEADKPDA